MAVDTQTQLGVALGAIALVAGITYVRFCGSTPPLPPKPPAPIPASGTETQLLQKSAGSPTLYLDFLQKDASLAAVNTPTIEEMSRKLPYRVDEARHVLEVGQPPIELAGLRLRIVKGAETLNLEITNATGSEAAYEVVTEPIPNASSCNSAHPLPLNVLVITKGATETRVECTWHDRMALAVTKVETLEVNPLQAYYLSEVPPMLLNIDERVARAHHGVDNKDRCSTIVAQAVRTGVDRGEITWRDLIDFYARHRCQTYQFPATYRAFTSDSQHALPAAGTGM